MEYSELFFPTSYHSKTKEHSLLYNLFIADSNLKRWIHAFLKHIGTKWSTNSPVLNLNSGFWFHFLRQYHHHHHVVPLARISLTLSRHFSLSFIVSGRSSGLHPISSHSCCMYVWASRPAFAQPYVGVHRSTSLMSSSLLLQQCPACLVHLTWIVFVMGGRWPYSWCVVGCCFQNLFNIACNNNNCAQMYVIILPSTALFYWCHT